MKKTIGNSLTLFSLFLLAFILLSSTKSVQAQTSLNTSFGITQYNGDFTDTLPCPPSKTASVLSSSNTATAFSGLSNLLSIILCIYPSITENISSLTASPVILTVGQYTSPSYSFQTTATHWKTIKSTGPATCTNYYDWPGSSGITGSYPGCNPGGLVPSVPVATTGPGPVSTKQDEGGGSTTWNTYGKDAGGNSIVINTETETASESSTLILGLTGDPGTKYAVTYPVSIAPIWNTTQAYGSGLNVTLVNGWAYGSDIMCKYVSSDGARSASANMFGGGNCQVTVFMNGNSTADVTPQDSGNDPYYAYSAGPAGNVSVINAPAPSVSGASAASARDNAANVASAIQGLAYNTASVSVGATSTINLTGSGFDTINPNEILLTPVSSDTNGDSVVDLESSTQDPTQLIFLMPTASVQNYQVQVRTQNSYWSQSIALSSLINPLTSLNTTDPMPATATDLGPISSSDSNISENLVLGVTVDPTKQAALSQYLQELYDPTSPNYHNYLTPDQYAQNYGRTPVEMAALTNWLSSNGFTNISPSSNNSIIDFTGTLGQLETAFNVTFDKYSVSITNNGSTISNTIVSKGGTTLSTSTSNITCYAANGSESVPSSIAYLTSGFASIGSSCANPPQPAISGTTIVSTPISGTGGKTLPPSTTTPIISTSTSTTNSVPARPIYSCPPQYTLIPSNNTCSPSPSAVQAIPAIRTYSCPNGYSQISSSSPMCTNASKRSVLAAKIAYSCPTGYVLNGMTCKNVSTTSNMPATVRYSCPLSYILNPANNTCSNTPSNPIKPTVSWTAGSMFAAAISAVAMLLATFLR